MKTVIPIIFCFIFFSCHDTPAIVTSELTVNCTVMHHSYTVPGGRVYLKNGTTTWPGQSVSAYDLSLPVDQNGRVTFDGLGSGAHVFYALAWDTVVADSVSGYMVVNITLDPGETKSYDLTIPVSE